MCMIIFIIFTMDNNSIDYNNKEKKRKIINK